MTRRALLNSAAERFAQAGIEDPRRNAEWLLEEATGEGRAALYARADAEVQIADAASFEDMVVRRLTRQPVQYVMGHADFYRLRLNVTADVLIPRPETEELVEEALSEIPAGASPWVLDIGTGSGAIALAIKSERPGATVVAADVSPEALVVASDNASRLNLDVVFVLADVLRPHFAEHVAPAFDLIISNPPYVPAIERESLEPEVRDHEPGVALFVPDADPLLFYRALAGHAEFLLKPSGRLLVETHSDYGAAVRALFAASGLAEATLKHDLSGRPRMASARRPH